MGYLQLEELMARNPAAALPVSAIKLGVVATASLCMFELSPLIHSADYAGGISEALTHLSLQFPNFGAILSSPLAVGGILYTGLVTTAAALWVESIAFARVPATDASIILTTEPIFAAAAGAVTLGETFGKAMSLCRMFTYKSFLCICFVHPSIARTSHLTFVYLLLWNRHKRLRRCFINH